MAMRIGGEYKLRNIRLYQWRRQAQALRIDPTKMIARIDELARQISEHVPEVRRRMKIEGIRHPIVGTLAEALTARMKEGRSLMCHRGEKELAYIVRLVLLGAGVPDWRTLWGLQGSKAEGRESATPFPCWLSVHLYLSRWLHHRRLAPPLPFVVPRQKAK